MRILQLTKKYPFPLKDGESIAIFQTARILARMGGEVHLLAMNTTRHFFSGSGAGKPAELSFYQRINTVAVDNRIRWHKALWNLFSSRSYHLERFIDPAFSQRLQELLEQTTFDIIQLETPYLAPYLDLIRQYSRAKICLRAHNVEYEIWQRISQNLPRGLRKLYLQVQVRRLRRYELGRLPHYDAMLAITDRDLQHFRRQAYEKPALVFPVPLALSEYPADYEVFRRAPGLAFIGSLDWAPNLEGIRWFLREVWPELKHRYPELSLHLAGRNTPADLMQRKQPGVVVHGEVEDARAFMQGHGIHIVPLFSGSGIRVKILEAMALGRVVISTPVGAEGISAGEQQGLLLAQDGAAFIDQIRKCLEDWSNQEVKGRRARKYIEAHFGAEQLGRQLWAFYRELLGKKS